MSADGPGRVSDTRVADAQVNDASPGDTEAAAQDAADLGKSAAGAANQPGTTTDADPAVANAEVDTATAVDCRSAPDNRLGVTDDEPRDENSHVTGFCTFALAGNPPNITN